MSDKTFLAQFVAARGLPAEPIATALLTHILASSEPARKSLEELAAAIHPTGAFAGMEFTEQAVIEGGEGRPDVIGSLANGVAMLIEAKFDAGLTAAQSSEGYLGGLADGGLLLFLVPEDRIELVWRELLVGPGGVSALEVPPPRQTGTRSPRWLRRELADDRMLAVTSWQELLSRLERATQGSPVASDMDQLTGLVRARVATEWTPVSGDDLSQNIGRRLTRLRDAAASAANVVGGGKSASGNNDFGPARWVLDDAGSRLYWAGLRLPTWAEFGISPLWAVFFSNNPVRRKAAKDALAPLNDAGGPGVFDVDKRTVGVPLVVPVGKDIDFVRNDLIAQMARIRSLLSAKGAKSDGDEGAAGPTQSGP